MEQLLVSLISGAVGGNAAGALMKNKSLGVLWNSVAGIVGGGLGGQILSMITGGAGGGSSLIQNIAGSGVGGAILLAVISYVKGAMKK